jgi:conflict system pore-forming effector with SLATT domain
MNQRNEEFMKLYQKYRYDDQIKFYKDRSQEFKEANEQLLNATGVIMIITAGVSAATALQIPPFWKTVLAILAVGLPALSTALAAYNELFAFERQSKLYQDAENALLAALAESPDVKKQGLSESEYDIAVGVYVNVVEGVFRKEQGQWGQLQSQAKMVELPAAKTKELLEGETAKEESAGLPEDETTKPPDTATPPPPKE